ncbi:MAG TPA: hypothetical protein VIV60_02845 [Polyangiaceae bacterium]
MSRGMQMLCCCGLLASSELGCSRKGPECLQLIGSLNDLGAQLASAQKVTGDERANPEQLAAALRPFTAAARAASKRLNDANLTQSELRQIAQNAATATSALAEVSSHLVETAEQLTGLDSAGRAVTEQKKMLDATEGDIKKICDAKTSACIELAKILAGFPTPPDANSDAPTSYAWSSRVSAWTKDLSRLELKDQGLASQVKAFETGWLSFANAMETLVRMSENAKKYDEFAGSFNAQIDRANEAISAANRYCAN